MTPKKMQEVLKDAFENNEQLLIVGKPGVGKTSIIEQICKLLSYRLIKSHPAVSDPTDYKGLPTKAVEGDHASFLPFGETWDAIQAKEKTIWFVDDLGQASEAVQKALMQLLLGRRLNGHKLSDHITFVGATNDITHRAGVSGLIEPVKSRWDSIIHLEENADDWIEWAIANKMPVELIAYIKNAPHKLCEFEPTKSLVNSPSPRTWASVGKRLARGVSDFEILAGAIGKGATKEFLAFLALSKNAPDLNYIIQHPDKADIPKEMSILYLVTTGLATKATKDNLNNIITYLDRLKQPLRVYCLRSAINFNGRLAESKAFQAWVDKEGEHLVNA